MASRHNLLVTLGMDIRGFDVQGISCSHVGAHVTRRPLFTADSLKKKGGGETLRFASFFFLPEKNIPTPMGELRYTM